LTAALAVASAAPVLAVKNDKVVMQNGDQLTGEIKKAEQGHLRFKTTATDAIDVRWELITRLISSQRFEIEVEAGDRYYGSLGEPRSEGRIRILDDDGTSAELDLQEVVRISPIKQRFWGRVDGELSVGFNYTQSSDVTQFNFDSSSRYRAERYIVDLGISSITTDQETGATSRSDLTLNTQRLRPRRRFVAGLLSLQSNEELGIDLRVLVGGSVGRHFIQTTHDQLSAAVGLAVNREELVGVQDSNEQLEALLAVSYLIFRDWPRKVSLNTQLRVFPSLNHSSRTRAELDVDYTHEIVKDFFWGMTLYSSYDSRPPLGAEDSDFGVVMSIGWQF